MGVRESATLRSGIALPRGALFTDLWPDRSAPDCGMDSGRQTQRPFSTSDAQIHLEPNAARGLTIPPSFRADRSAVEESRGVTAQTAPRDPSTSLGMTMT